MWYKFSNININDDTPFDIYELKSLSDDLTPVISVMAEEISYNHQSLPKELVDTFKLIYSLFENNRGSIYEIVSVISEREEHLMDLDFSESEPIHENLEKFNISNTEKLFFEFNKIRKNIFIILDKVINAIPSKGRLLLVREIFKGK